MTSSSSSSSSSSTSVTTSSVSTSSVSTSTKYPATDDDSIENPDLDTEIPMTEMSSLFIHPGFPMAKCMVSGFVGEAATVSKDNAPPGPVEKHLEMDKIRISHKYASYFFDQTDFFLLAYFEADVKSAYEAFWNNNLP